MKALFLQG
jgi:N-alpha-acetyltransferase 15/16, NatA auxiliary subunit